MDMKVDPSIVVVVDAPQSIDNRGQTPVRHTVSVNGA